MFRVNSTETSCSYSPPDEKDFKSKRISRARGQAGFRGRLITRSPHPAQKTGAGQIKRNPVQLQGKMEKYLSYSVHVSGLLMAEQSWNRQSRRRFEQHSYQRDLTDRRTVYQQLEKTSKDTRDTYKSWVGAWPQRSINRLQRMGSKGSEHNTINLETDNKKYNILMYFGISDRVSSNSWLEEVTTKIKTHLKLNNKQKAVLKAMECSHQGVLWEIHSLECLCEKRRVN